ncbi:MAG: NAD-dependent epimerase/dehydratase family protein [Elusimicrobiaceae bacterium]|nr:NAD-dependent epimerase/dehydratase family protein [Elusimicrobiaceae bacterium]
MTQEFELRSGVPANEPTLVWGCDKTFSIDLKASKRVLITGKDSFIGNSLIRYAKTHYPNIAFDVLDMRTPAWKNHDFSQYESVFHVAGLAHADVGHVSAEMREKYYQVNTDLALHTAQVAKQAKVSQFIFMSSMIIYGESAPYGQLKIITKDTCPAPANFYGDSKWQADKAVRALENESFRVAVLRPPMVYGQGCKGNYPLLQKLAHKLPVFPNVHNERSMIYIDNLCEFVCQLILSGENGIYFPQNPQYTRTADMVKLLGKAEGKNIRLLSILNPCVKLASFMPGKIRALVNKAFGNCCYAQELSHYNGLNYQIYDLQTSICPQNGF